MHESALARQIAAIALQRAASAGARVVRRVSGWVAETEKISIDSLRLHFTGATRGTPAEGAALDLRITHVQARCGSCGATYAPEHHLLLCPRCGATGGVLLGQTGLGVDTLDVD